MSKTFKFLQKVWFKTLPAVVWNISDNEIQIMVLMIIDNNAFWFDTFANPSELELREQEFSQELYEIRKSILND